MNETAKLTNERLSELADWLENEAADCDGDDMPLSAQNFRDARETVRAALSRAHPEEAEPDTDRRLKERDDFIVSSGLWDDFTKSLPTKSLQRFEGAEKAIWDEIERRIDDAPVDGINAEGNYSLTVDRQQAAFVDGLRSARLAAINALPSHGTGKPDGGE